LAVKIRLARAGAKKAPFYRVIAADGRATRDGRFLEILGRYNPRSEPSSIELDLAKVDAWIGKGAQPTEAAAKLIAIARGEKTAPVAAARVSKKAASKADADKKVAAEAEKNAAAEPETVAEGAAAEPATAVEAKEKAKAEKKKAAAEEAAPIEEPKAAAEEAAADDAEPVAE
jgi:small subunit ribosomal protein S16